MGRGLGGRMGWGVGGGRRGLCRWLGAVRWELGGGSLEGGVGGGSVGVGGRGAGVVGGLGGRGRGGGGGGGVCSDAAVRRGVCAILPVRYAVRCGLRYLYC